RILASTEVKFGLANGLPDGGTSKGGAVRSAVATASGGACFSIGSYAARLDSSQSPILGPLLADLGSNVSLSSADYQGLAHSAVSLADFLGVNLGAGTMKSLIQADKLIGIDDYYLAVAKAL